MLEKAFNYRTVTHRSGVSWADKIVKNELERQFFLKRDVYGFLIQFWDFTLQIL
ncbi:hypothetical protein HJ01_02673 [Flavobacterium frigoris PS1]|uniref:Uncharacterized protein n=1 Tax=Flavobacterium frigoris (strain PS1) TaxID=1086011 RepID=H7FUC8_FLAFP|nr:hypothetical protein HJ01_02673 [Flavobacterium frigoris PS1]